MKTLILVLLLVFTRSIVYADIPCNQTLSETAAADEYFQRGKSCIGAYQFRQSLADFTTAISLDPDQPAYYAYRGYINGVVLHTPTPEEIFPDFDIAIELDPDYAFTYFARGKVYDKYGEYLDALADYNRAIDLDPDFGDAYIERAHTMIALGETRRAISDLSAYRGSDVLTLAQIEDLRQRYNDGEFSQMAIDGCTAKTVYSNVTLRADATRSSKAMNVLRRMASIVGVTGFVDTRDGYRWYEVHFAGTNGYIRGDLLRLDTDEACAMFE